MCGICGVVDFNYKTDPSLIKMMVNALISRGPDDEGIFFDRNSQCIAALGHRRLSIIDLTTGHQPISNEDNTLFIVFNGEIYNFRELRKRCESKGHIFKTNSDTEVIIHLYEEYGLDSIGMLNGMFAFAIFDKKRNELVLARDRFGIKPLYYFASKGKIVFASLLGAIQCDPEVVTTMDTASISDYFTLLYIPSPKTIFREIKKLPPAHYIKYGNNGIEIKRYWKLNTDFCDCGKFDKKKENQYIEKTRELLKNSIERQLISDVPIGIFLSGGVDSSAITAIAAGLSNSRLHTFSIGFEKGGYYDERKFSRTIARIFQTDHKEIVVDPLPEESLNEFIKNLDEPFADSSCIPMSYLAKFTKRYVKVALSGTGGDDLFGGYRRYYSHNFESLYSKLPVFFKKGLSGFINMLPSSRKNILGEKLFLAKKFMNRNFSSGNNYIELMYFFRGELLKNLFNEEIEESGYLENISKEFVGLPRPEKYIRTDFLSYLPEDLLVKEDRMTMAYGLESRVPFLDNEILDFALKLPAGLKVKGICPKYILKKTAESYLPKNIIYREKHGFSVPIGEWIKKELKDFTYDTLLRNNSEAKTMFNKVFLKDLLDRHISNKDDYSQHIWALLVFELWLKKAKKVPNW